MRDIMVMVCWKRNGSDALVVPAARAEAGYWIGTDPVERVSRGDVAAVSAAFCRAADHSGYTIHVPNPRVVKTPTSYLKHSKERTVAQFEKAHMYMTIKRSRDGIVTVQGYKSNPEGHGYVPDKDRTVVLPMAATFVKAAEAAVTMMLGAINIPNSGS